ncbi:MAG: ABC transporter substrate-binding protein [Dactylosporangium sp.]|nr:ABC transporter substrate-binding protein [Dactylosporangium sp.]
MQLIYESLFMFNLLDSQLEPQLGASFEQEAVGITVKMQTDAKWRDGEPVTAADVVYTWDLGQRNKDVYWSASWEYLESVTEVDEHTVLFTFKPDNVNPGMVKTAMCETWILPKHLWEDYEQANPKIMEFANDNPVGSGPYTVKSGDAQQLIFERNDDYWGKGVRGKLPGPKRIVHPIFKDNAAGDLAFERGEVDVMQQFTPQIWKMWQDKKKPVGTWFTEPPYYIPGGMPMLVPNTSKPGLSNPKVRRALAFSIDYARIAEQAMSKYSDPVNSSLILPKGSDAQYFDEANVAEHGWKYDPEQAKKILEEELGATKDSDGVYVLPDGTKLGGWKLQTPTGWTDWQTAIQVVAESAKKVGFGIELDYPQANQLTPNVQTGNFDLVLWYIGAQTTAATPWQRYRDVMDKRGTLPIGQNSYYNYGRFEHPEVPALLDAATTATGDELKKLLKQLDTIFMQNAPMIPLMYRPLDFFEYNESVWSGFPNEKDPSAPPTFSGAGMLWLYEISAK